MKATFLKIILFFSCLMIGCRHSNDEKSTLKFDLKELPKLTNLKLSDLGFKSIEYIPLETSDSSLIKRKFSSSYGDKMLIGNDYFIIQQFTSILKFNINGSFIKKIGTVGRGPNEFLACNDLEIDEHNHIYVVDGWKQKLFIYSENGDFIKTVAFPLYGAVDFVYTEGKFLCYNQNNMGNIINSFNLVDTNGIIVKSFPNKYPFKKHPTDAYGYSHENIFYRFNNQIFKKEVYSDTIYNYENLRFKPHLIIEVGNKLITPQLRSQFEGIYLAQNYISPRNLFEFGDYIYYEFQYKFDFSNSDVYGFIGSKRNDSNFLIDPTKGLINDLDGGPNILPFTIFNDNTIIG